MTAGVKISALPTVASLMGSSIAPFVQGGQTVRGGLWMLPFDPRGTGAQTRTIQSKLQDYVSSGDYPLPVNYQAARAALLGSIALPATDIIGLLNLAFSGAGQIAFPATQNPSLNANTLDDYEEGTWTPTVSGSVVSGTQTYGTQTGSYTKIGNRVLYEMSVVLTAKDGATSGNLQIAGLPFPSAGAAAVRHSSSIGAYNLLDINTAGGYSQIVAAISGNGLSVISISECGDNVSSAVLTEVDFSATSAVRISGHYMT